MLFLVVHSFITELQTACKEINTNQKIPADKQT
jgi:hypothetical protein